MKLIIQHKGKAALEVTIPRESQDLFEKAIGQARNEKFWGPLISGLVMGFATRVEEERQKDLANAEVDTTSNAYTILALRRAVRIFYDIQRLRMQSGARDTSDTAVLDEGSKIFMGEVSAYLELSEKRALREIARLLNKIPIYTWLSQQKGVGPTMAGVMLAYFDIHRADTASSLWTVAGLAVDRETGKAVRRKKGVKANFNLFLKTKMWVLAGSFLKTNSPWRKFYDDYKHRKTSQIVEICAGCEGTGKYARTAREEEFDTAPAHGSKCSNCSGTGGPAPWGRSDAHRHNAAMRYMVKMFLAELYGQWRPLEGLPVRAPYAEQYLGHVHHDKR